jgi:hypothetical protein
MTLGRHPDLDIASAIRDHFAERQDNIKFPAASGDFPDVGQVATGVARFQVGGHSCRGGTIGDEPGDDVADNRVLTSGMCRGIDQVELTLADAGGASGSAYGSTGGGPPCCCWRSWSTRRRPMPGSPDNQTASASACYDIETVDLGLLSPCT